MLKQLLLLIAHTLCYATALDPTENYQNNITLLLDKPNELILFWSHTSTSITFELHVKRSRWVAFGIKNYYLSDIVLAWLNPLNGTGHFSERTLTNLREFYTDDKQNYKLIDAFSVANDYTIFKFERQIRIHCGGCNSSSYEDDLDIVTGLNNVVYWHGNAIDYLNETIQTPYLAFKPIVLLNDSLGPFACSNEPARPVFNSKPTDLYLNQFDLAADGDYRLYWNFTNDDLVSEIHCRTPGWVGFGLSPFGNMTTSDMIIGWVDSTSGLANFTDRFANGIERPVVDVSQDWRLLFAAERNGYTILKFTRPLKLCNAEDNSIEVITF
jgi:hypothetical protein